MPCIYSSLILAEVKIVADQLAAQGIEPYIKNSQLSGVVGGIPPAEARIELLVSAEDEQRARQVLAENASDAADAAKGPLRACSVCGEDIEPQFAVCWNCGKATP